MAQVAAIYQLEEKRAEYMGSPQVEDGHVRLANELFDAILSFKFSGRQLKVLMAIIRKTYGYNKKEDDISSSQIAALCSLNRGHVSTTINHLAKMRVINKAQGVFGCVLSINKQYMEWIELEEDDIERQKKVVNRVSNNHYTYVLTLPQTGQFYIGVRSCKCHPNQDRYKGSGNWTFTVPKNDLEKKVIKTFETRKEAELHEVELIRQNAGNCLMTNSMMYTKGTWCSESEQGVQNPDFACSEYDFFGASETEHTKDRFTKDNQKTKTMSGKPDFAAEVIDYLNTVAGTKFRNVKANLSLIASRAKEGATLEQMKSVIDRKAADWPVGDKMRQYLRPATLFNATNFDQYLGSLSVTSAKTFSIFDHMGGDK